MNNLPRESWLEGSSQLMRRIRRSVADVSFENFARTYLARHFASPPSPMHEELFALIEGGVTKGGARIAAAIPLGYGATTLASLALPLWAASYERAQLIVIVSSGPRDAGEHVANLARELRHNRQLVTDFPHLRLTHHTRKDVSSRSLLQIGSGIRVVAAGLRTNLQSIVFGSCRPDLIVVDQIDPVGRKQSKRHRNDAWTWFTESLMQPGPSPVSIVVVGTRHLRDGILWRLVEAGESDGWYTRMYKAVISSASNRELWWQWTRLFRREIELEGHSGPEAAVRFYTANADAMLEGAKVLWPARGSYLQLMQARLREGWWRFEGLKQHVPKVRPCSTTVTLDLDPREPFPRHHFWLDEMGLLWRSLGREVRTATLVSPWSRHERERIRVLESKSGLQLVFPDEETDESA